MSEDLEMYEDMPMEQSMGNRIPEITGAAQDHLAYRD